jgi:hypothetical protein
MCFAHIISPPGPQRFAMLCMQLLMHDHLSVNRYGDENQLGCFFFVVYTNWQFC